MVTAAASQAHGWVGTPEPALHASIATPRDVVTSAAIVSGTTKRDRRAMEVVPACAARDMHVGIGRRAKP